MPSLKQKIAKLKKEIEHHEQLYRVQNAPAITDESYDKLVAQLAELETEHGDAAPDSPTQKIGSDLTEGFAKIEHSQPMYSIDNTYNEEDLRAWDRSNRKNLDGDAPTYVCEPKVDGVAISLRYEHGNLIYAVTRGDGRRGDDVTANASTIKSIPMSLDQTLKNAKHEGLISPAHVSDALPQVIEVRGEVYLDNADFDTLNAKHRIAEAERVAAAKEKGKTIVARADYANPRNFTAGTLKQKESAVTASRPLKFVAHGFGEMKPPPHDSYYEAVLGIAALGLPTSKATKRAKDIDEAIAIIRAFDAERKTLPFNTDGMVVKVDSKAHRERLGYTSKSPRWVIAYKYPAERVQTVLNDVTWQVGKSGKLTPVAELEPVFVAGTTVRRATLHNIVNIEKLDLHLGDTVTIEKAGEIIPQVISADPARRKSHASLVQAPKNCPSCEAAVERETDGPNIFCENPSCPSQLLERLKHFAGRKQMNIDGLGERLIEELIDAGKLTSIPDLYRLSAETIAAIETEHERVNGDGETVISVRKVGQKTADNVMASLEASKGRGLASVLAGLGARFLGNTNGRKLAAWAGEVEKLYTATATDLRSALSEAEPNEADEKRLRTLAQSIIAGLAATPRPAADVEDRLEQLKYITGLTKRLGEDRIEQLAARFLTVEDLDAACEDELYEALRTNLRTAEVLHDFFHSASGQSTLNELKRLGVRTTDTTIKPAGGGPLLGMSVVVTGTLPTLGRAEMEEKIVALGGKASAAVSKKTSFVVAGENAGSKLEKAKQLGVDVIDEAEFLKRYG